MVKIVDILKLQHEHPERLQFAEDGMRDFGYKTWRLQLLKELGDAYVYKIMDAVSEEDEYDDGEENEDYDDDSDEIEVETFGCEECEAIVADSKGNVYFTTVLTYNGSHYTKEEIRRWRYNFFEALLDISKRGQYMTKEECLEEIVGMTDYRIASLMPFNTPEGYADIVAL